LADEIDQTAKRLLALFPDQLLDSLAGLIAAKLTSQNGGVMLPKQKVASSNLVSRSTTYDQAIHKYSRRTCWTSLSV